LENAPFTGSNARVNARAHAPSVATDPSYSTTTTAGRGGAGVVDVGAEARRGSYSNSKGKGWEAEVWNSIIDYVVYCCQAIQNIYDI